MRIQCKSLPDSYSLVYTYFEFKKLTMSKKGVAGDRSLYYLLRSFYGVLAVTIFTKKILRGFGQKV